MGSRVSFLPLVVISLLVVEPSPSSGFCHPSTPSSLAGPSFRHLHFKRLSKRFYCGASRAGNPSAGICSLESHRSTLQQQGRGEWRWRVVSGCDCDGTVFGRGIMTVEASATAREENGCCCLQQPKEFFSETSTQAKAGRILRSQGRISR